MSAPLPSKPVEEKPYYRKLKESTPSSVSVEPAQKPDDRRESTDSQQSTSTAESKSNFVKDFIKQEKAKLQKSPQADRKNKQEQEPMDVDEPITKDKGKGKLRFSEDRVKLEDFVFVSNI